MTDALKRQQVLKDLKQQLLAKFGTGLTDQINAEIFRLINKKRVDAKDLSEVHEVLAKGGRASNVSSHKKNKAGASPKPVTERSPSPSKEETIIVIPATTQPIDQQRLSLPLIQNAPQINELETSSN
jgi:hypothetical protein